MSKRNIAFIIPQHINPDFKFGGVLQLYLLVDSLNKHSDKYSASVLRLGKELTWLDPKYKSLETENITLEGFDTVVIPEVIPQAAWWWPTIPNKVLYAQAFARPYLLAPLSRLIEKTYNGLGYKHVWAVSPFVSEKISEENLWNREIGVVPNVFHHKWLDQVQFIRRHTLRKQAKVLFVDRKGCEPFNDVLISKIKSDKTREWEVSRISTASEEEVIREMASSKCVVLNYKEEGFYRMALEAILCGCVPIVYPAGGGSYFLKHKVNSLVVDSHTDISKYWYYIKYATDDLFYNTTETMDFSVDVPTREVDIAKVVEGLLRA